MSRIGPKANHQTAAAELSLQFGLSFLEENVARIREAAINGIRTFPKPDKLTTSAYFYASAFLAYEHLPSNRDPISVNEFIKLNEQMVIKVDIRKSFAYLKKQMNASKSENPYDLSLNGKIQVIT